MTTPIDPGEMISVDFTLQEIMTIDTAVAIGAMTGIVPVQTAGNIIETIKAALPASVIPPTDEIPAESIEP